MSSTFGSGLRRERASFALLATVLLALGILFGAPIAAHARTTVYLNQGSGNDSNSGATSAQPVKTIDRAAELAGEGGTVVLTSAYSVPSGTTVEVTGISVKRGFVGQTLFSVRGSLVLDCEVDGSGDTTGVAPIVMLTGGKLVLEDGAKLHGASCTNQPGGAVCAYDGSTIEMNGGSIESNHAQEASAIQLFNTSVAYLNGGSIHDNTEEFGGTVQALLDSEIILNGTVVGDNVDDNGDGAIFVSGSSLTIKAGNISSESRAVTTDRWNGTDSSVTLGCANPILSGSICVRNEDGDDFTPIKVANGFSTTSPIGLEAWYTLSSGVVAAAYDGVTPKEGDFASPEGIYDNLFAVEGNAIVWRRATKVMFRKYENGAWSYADPIAVEVGKTIPTSALPAVTMPGYNTVWSKIVDRTYVPWDFETETVGESWLTLYSTFRLDPATVSISGETTVHEGNIKLTANATHPAEGATFAYQWLKDGKEIDGATAAVLETSEGGSYSVRVTVTVGKQTATMTTDSVACTITRHEMGEWTVTKKPTTSDEGTETRTCRLCDKTETRSVAKLAPEAKKEIPQTGEDALPVLALVMTGVLVVGVGMIGKRP